MRCCWFCACATAITAAVTAAAAAATLVYNSHDRALTTRVSVSIVEQLAIQQQIELLQQQQQQIQATHQQYVNMGLLPPGQLGAGGQINPLQQPMPNMSP